LGTIFKGGFQVKYNNQYLDINPTTNRFMLVPTYDTSIASYSIDQVHAAVGTGSSKLGSSIGYISIDTTGTPTVVGSMPGFSNKLLAMSSPDGTSVMLICLGLQQALQVSGTNVVFGSMTSATHFTIVCQS
jgi:hypothetical protein